MPKKTKTVLILLFFGLILFMSESSGKRILKNCPQDNTYIYEDTILPDKLCNVEDSRMRKPGEEGVIIIKASNIVLDCNGMILNGTGYSKEDYPNFRFGIFNHGFHNVTVKNCIVKNYQDGILFVNTTESKIFNNTLILNLNGIVIDNAIPRYFEKWERRKFGYPEPVPSSGFNSIFNNILISNGGGINLLCTDQNSIFNNNITSSKNFGIQIENSSWNKIFNNIIISNQKGIFITENSSNNEIINNTITDSFVGIESVNSSLNEFSDNIFLNNKRDLISQNLMNEKGGEGGRGINSALVNFYFFLIAVGLGTLFILLLIFCFEKRIQ